MNQGQGVRCVKCQSRKVLFLQKVVRAKFKSCARKARTSLFSREHNSIAGLYIQLIAPNTADSRHASRACLVRPSAYSQ